jgi:hypothetical protein
MSVSAASLSVMSTRRDATKSTATMPCCSCPVTWISRGAYGAYVRTTYPRVSKNDHTCVLPSAVCRLLSAVCRLPSAVCRSRSTRDSTRDNEAAKLIPLSVIPYPRDPVAFTYRWVFTPDDTPSPTEPVALSHRIHLSNLQPETSTSSHCSGYHIFFLPDPPTSRLLHFTPKKT